MADGIEAELKVAVDAAGASRLARLSDLPGLTVVAKGDKRLVSTYFDTPDLALRAKGISLRLRRSGRSGEQTVKFSGSFSLGLAERPEFNVAHAGRVPDLARLPEEAAAELTRLVDGRPLVPLFSMRVTRRRWEIATPGGDRVEMALDRGTATAGSRRADIREVEFELLSGDRRALFEAARLALNGVAFHFSTEAKSDLGYALLEGEIGAAEPKTATDADLDDDMSVEMALQRVLRSCAIQISANVAALRADDDPEGAHQLRVGLRRLRTALKIFASVMAPGSGDPLATEARRLAQEVAATRDMDVLIDELVAPLEGGDMAALIELLEKRRKAARVRLAAVLADRSTGDFLLDLLAFTETRGWLSTDDIGQSLGLAAPIEPFADHIVGRLRRKVEKLGRDPEALSSDERHELRKRFKRLRYAYDFFEDLLPKSVRRKLLPRVKAAQNVLGVLNDIHMAHLMLDDIHAAGPKAGAVERAIGYCLGWHSARAKAIWERRADDLSLD
ncbi:CYTH and CHAD domain-containing protein [Pleomorphomonas sp. NRK KF1]|uniref:CYTH and CHAD domain-containing protein n=1 Tax=Pleomorphomonas sp. NRK KF1 TaxID=2943000 RepID=UPI002044BFEB|nr:CYTH and CHAD domain-containing protein [Pleomorphomonas sp. NRK KF1]MCM5555594.1 CHAD domain-containing protein [Pleomorphomonas sp. NRK KF1]